jgi:2-hydroxy-4-carboxymuconate semialdehyde hemiacetal dehydrogenase
MKICLAGEGAQGISHAEVLQDIEGVEIDTLAGGIAADAEAFASQRGIPHWSLDLEECLSRDEVEAVILTTPNQVHCAQTELALNMGKHVLVEIPMGISLAESQRIAELEERTGLVCMVCHTQRYNSAFREVYRQVQEGELTLHHIVQQTYFFRRRNENRFGKKRTWVDALLWHQACHMVDMCYWLLDDPDMEGWGQAGPLHAELAVPMDISIGMRTKDGKLVTSANSFNNYGPIYSEYRFIGEEATLLAQKGKLTDHEGQEIKLQAVGGMDAQDREFFASIKEGRQPLTSCRACLPTMEIIDRIQRSIDV